MDTPGECYVCGCTELSPCKVRVEHPGGLSRLRHFGHVSHPIYGGRMPDQSYERNREMLNAGAEKAQAQQSAAANERRNSSLITRDNLHTIFTYHAPSPEQQEQYKLLRAAAYDFANAILALTPVCADQQAALRKVREATMTANAALEGKL